MFKKSNDSRKEYDDVQTLIGPSIEVKGDFNGEGDVVVEGRLAGTLKTKRDLRVGAGAKIEANVEAENVFIAGEITGNIKARAAVEMTEGSRVNGDIETKSLMVEKGAILNGSCMMSSEAGIENKKEGKGKQNSEEIEEIFGRNGGMEDER